MHDDSAKIVNWHLFLVICPYKWFFTCEVNMTSHVCSMVPPIAVICCGQMSPLPPDLRRACTRCTLSNTP